MNAKKVLAILGELRMLPFFPNDEIVMAAILRLVDSMCADETQVRWLIDKMTSGIYAEWPGPAEMRACFCHRYPPKDGITMYSAVYPDGLPPDLTAPPRIEAPRFTALPPGHQATADVELEESIQKLAEKYSKPPAHKFVRPLRDIETPPPDREKFAESGSVNPNFAPVTADDIARAVEELHRQKAREPEEPKDEEKPPNVVEIQRRKP